MASRYTLNPSPPSTSISDLLLFRFRQPICIEALIALEEREAFLQADNDALQSQCRSMHLDCCELNRWLEAERSKQMSMEENTRRLQVRIRGLEEMERSWKEEVDAVRNDTVILERQLEVTDKERKELEDEKVKMSRILDGLKKENFELEYELRQVKSQKEDEMDRVKKVKRNLEAEVNNLERAKSEENQRHLNQKIALDAAKKKIEDLSQRISVLEKEKGERDTVFGRMESAKGTEIARILNEKMVLETDKRRLEGDLKDKIPQLDNMIQVLKKEKWEKEAEIRKAKMENSTTVQRILSEKVAVEAQNRRLGDEMKERISELGHKNDILEKEKLAMEVEFRKTNGEKGAEIERLLNAIIDLEHQIQVLKTDNGEKNSEIEKIRNEKMALDMEKRRVEECLKEEHSKLVHRIEALEREKGDLETKVFKVEEEKNAMKKRIDTVKETLEAYRRRLEEEISEEISELVMRNGVLEKDKNDAYDRIVKLNKVLEAQKSRAEKAENQVSENLKIIGALERAKESLEAKISKVYRDVCKGIQRIGMLEREKEELEAKFCQAEKEKSVEIQMILNEKIAMESDKRAMKEDYEKMILELDDRNDILDSEKMGFEAEVAERDEVIKVLEREKRGCEAEIVEKNEEIKEKNEEIKVILQQNSCLVDKIKQLEMEINGLASKSKEDVLLANNFVTLSNFRQNEGKTFASSEHSGRINHGVKNADAKSEDVMTCTNACKRKESTRECGEPDKKVLKLECEHLSTSRRSTDADLVDVNPETVPCETNTEMNTTRCTNGRNGGSGQVASGNIACEWQVDQDALDAFDVHPELCLKAVCALYRQQKRLGDSTSAPLSSEGIALAEYLISEDPEGRKTKKMVAKLDKFDRDAVGECINIAKQHYKQVFQIFRKKDPIFFP